MFKRKKQTEGEGPTIRTPASAEDELNALLTRTAPRRLPAAVDLTVASPFAAIPAPVGDAARRTAASAAAQARGRSPAGANGTAAEGRKLIVGKDICLTGEVTCCECLVVEGRVELSRTDARQIQVMTGGLFIGNVDVDDADIAGGFEGEMTVRDRLTVRAGGRVEGRIRYRNIVVEAGGAISGDIGVVDAAPAAVPALAAAAPAAAATPPRRPEPVVNAVPSSAPSPLFPSGSAPGVVPVATSAGDRKPSPAPDAT